MAMFRSLASLLAVLLFYSQTIFLGAAEFDSKGAKIAYKVHGQGQPVILIHGFISSGVINWDLPGVTALLAKDFQVITMDVRGHGQSDKPTKEEAYGPELVEDVVRLLDHLKIKKAHIVGYSMGGIITAKFIAKHPDPVISGMLCGMGWLPEGELAKIGFGTRGKGDGSARDLCFRSLGKLGLTRDELKGIKVPMNVLVGDKDNVVKGLYIDNTLRKERPDWPIVEIKDGDHITTLAKPQFKEEVQKWLLKQSKRSGSKEGSTP
jgi:pimeloyl-ACP methyl ester carboxylesterase